MIDEGIVVNFGDFQEGFCSFGRLSENYDDFFALEIYFIDNFYFNYFPFFYDLYFRDQYL